MMQTSAQQQLIETVQLNCHISDARHAGGYTLCTYLMKMRELFRWEHGFGFEEKLEQDALGEWVRNRETYWEDIEQQEFSAVRINGHSYDPFDQKSINTALSDANLVYSGGLGQNSVPHFFLAHVHECKEISGHQVLISGRELARDLTSPPAMTREGVIFLRHEAFRRLMWERIQEWRWNEADNAMGKTLACYDLDNNLMESLDQLTEDQIEVVLWHELGEVAAGKLLTGQWEELLVAVSGTGAEIRLRAIRDNLADALTTLNKLLENGEPRQIHFYFSMLTPLRKKLQPGLIEAYQLWSNTDSVERLESLVSISREHWQAVASGCIEIFQDGVDVSNRIVALADTAVRE